MGDVMTPAPGTPQGEGGEPAAGRCVQPGETCRISSCCAGATCVIERATGQTICAALCAAHRDCRSGCCVQVGNTAVSACAPPSACATSPWDASVSCTRPPGGPCLLANDCCPGDSCVAGVCASACMANAGCASGCCFGAAAGRGVCAGSQLCRAPGAGTSLDAMTPAVCGLAPGGSCLQSSDCCPDAFCSSGVCASPCTVNQDCGSGCCVSLSTGSRCAPRILCSLPRDAGAASLMVDAAAVAHDLGVDLSSPDLRVVSAVDASADASVLETAGPAQEVGVDLGSPDAPITSTIDAAAPPPPPPPPPPTCSQVGQGCGTVRPCCLGTTCVTDPGSQLPVCASICAVDQDCASGCCASLTGGGRACGPATLCQTPPPLACGRLIVRGGDGRYLGLASSSAFGSESVCNPYGSYGSSFSSTSIFNKFSTYGSEFGTYGAFNPFASSPPTIVCETSGTLRYFVSKNTFRAPRIDPDALCGTLAAMGL